MTRFPSAVLAVLVLHACFCATESATLRTANTTIPVGISAGAFFAVQYHIAFSKTTLGSGIIAGGPFYCASNSEVTALTACTKEPFLLNLDNCISAAKACESGDVCDSLSNLQQQRSWLYSGSHDTVVLTGVMKALEKFYASFMPSSAIASSFDVVPSAHGWVTQNYGNPCSHFGSPYIQNCQLDASYEMLSFIMGHNLTAGGNNNVSNYHKLSQAEYTPDKTAPSSLSLGPEAYVYAPASCFSKPGSCPVVLAFHGCEQTIADISTDYVGHSGLNELAETNGLVVLYPQAIRHDFAPLNPEGCFDWWGYTSSNYANKNGPQMSTVYNMAQALANGLSL